MVDSKFFGIPFAVSGDKATIPEDTQPSGAISYQQGYGPDYERDPATDPLAKRVPRDETNELYYQITNALRFLQLYGAPEWYALDDNGDPVSYPITARVRYDAGAGMQAWRSLIASNTTTPGANPAHWTLDEPYSTAALEATLAQALAGTSATTLVTPRRLASSVQQGVWKYAVAGGTANAWAVSLSPAPASLSAGMQIRVKVTNAPTAALTLNVNGLGAAPVLKGNGDAIASGYFVSGEIVALTYDGTAWRCENAIRRNGDFFNADIANQGVWGARSVPFPDTLSAWYVNPSTGASVLERRSISGGNSQAQLILTTNEIKVTDAGPPVTQTFKFRVSGSAAGVTFDNCGLGNNMAFGWTGSAIAFRVDGTNVGNVTPSDERLKTDIADIDGALSIINSLRPVSFRYDQAKSPIGFAPGVQFGFVAQELELLIPEIVSEWTIDAARPEETTYKQVDLLRLVPLLVKAIQEQQAQIDQMKNGS